MSHAWFLVLTLVLAVLGTQTQAQTLPTVGDGEQLWLLRQDTDKRSFTIHHYTQTAPTQGLRELQSFTGQIVPQGIAAGHGRLWLVYANLSVQSFRTVTDQTGQLALANRVQPNLPAGVVLRSLAVNRTGTYALVRVITSQALSAIDFPISTDDSTPDTSQSALEQKSEIRTSKAPTQPISSHTQPVALPVDRLLMLHRNQWIRIVLPDDWISPSAGAWLLATQDQADRLFLLASTYPADAAAPILRVYQRLITYSANSTAPSTAVATAPFTTEQTAAWSRHDYALPTPSAAPILVDGQIVVAHRSADTKKLELQLTVVRPEGVSDLGQLILDPAPSDQTWTLAPMGRTIALIASPPSGSITLNRMDLRGKTIADAKALMPTPRMAIDSHIDYLVLIAVLVVASLLLFGFWKREPANNQPVLPSDLEPADLAIRCFAGLIDLAPCLLITLLSFSLTPTQLLFAWPGRSGSLLGLIPGAVVIFLYILHCTITEIITGKSLGKMILGLRTVNLRGQRAKPWQIIVRNLAKALDLIPPFALLILPILSANRQRVGDLIAQTLVVAPTQPKQNNQDEDEEE